MMHPKPPPNRPLQNRVHPSGEILAVTARGTMMGNRGGRFHRDDQTLARRRWASKHWICCDLHYKNKHHEAMGRGYTSLFFLDEVTALAAGHRPCFFCRHAEAKAFVALSGHTTSALDDLLHIERTSARPLARHSDLVDGAMIVQGGAAYAWRDGTFLQWSFDGYAKMAEFKLAEDAKLLTPRTILAILRAGFQPRWHASSLKGN